MEKNWIEIGSRTRSFRLGSEPILIHIIKTGYSNTFMVIDEDGYEQMGDLKIMNSEQILEIYEIDISDWTDFTNKS